MSPVGYKLYFLLGMVNIDYVKGTNF